MKKLNTVAILVALVTLVFAYFYWQTNSDPTQMLIARNVPVPKNALATNSVHGGTFAQYLFVRFELNPGELKKYRTLLPGGIPLNAPSGIQIVTKDIDSAELWDLSDRKIHIKSTINEGHLLWWNIELIKNGTYHHKELEDACWYEIFIDEDNSVVYISWHYS
ncbi:hypothetical protein OAG68_01815 [bacterium]|nr:hypothetical protein [bacterium]